MRAVALHTDTSVNTALSACFDVLYDTSPLRVCVCVYVYVCLCRVALLHNQYYPNNNILAVG